MSARKLLFNYLIKHIFLTLLFNTYLEIHTKTNFKKIVL